MKISSYRLKGICLFLVAACMAGGLAVDASAQFARPPASKAEMNLSFAPVVKRAAPAVVNVFAKKVVRQKRSPLFDDPLFQRFFGGRSFGRPRKRIQRSLGSGVIVSADGIVVTNNHVVGDATDIKVVLSDKREFEADVVLKDKRTDLAILRLRASGMAFPYLAFADSDALEVGDLVLAIGNPFGVGQTVTSGIVSALARTRVGISDYQFFIQTDAAINPGNSGGALIGLDGQLAGINTAIYSKSGGSMGIGFAIPSNMVRLVVESARTGGKVKRPWFGARLQRITPEIAESLGLGRPVGAIVKRVSLRGPAADAGLKRGDVIVAVDGQPVEDPRAFKYRFATKGVGGHALVDIYRRGRRTALRVPLMAAPEDPPRNVMMLDGPSPFAGARIANLSPALAEELSVGDDKTGVIVLEVEERSPAWSINLKRGDIILRINGADIERVRTAKEVTAQSAARWRFSISRKGRVLRTIVGG